MNKRFIVEQQRLNLKKIIYSYINEPFIIKPLSIMATENFDNNQTLISCDFKENNVLQKMEFSGVGTVGSVFDKLIDLYSERYPSLKTLAFVEYSARPVFSDKSKTNSEAPVEVHVYISSASKKAIPFRAFDSSILRASIKCVFDCVQYYVNSEMCFKKLKYLVKEAQSRSRGDVAQKYISDISEIVKVTSYSDV